MSVNNVYPFNSCEIQQVAPQKSTWRGFRVCLVSPLALLLHGLLKCTGIKAIYNFVKSFFEDKRIVSIREEDTRKILNATVQKNIGWGDSSTDGKNYSPIDEVENYKRGFVDIETGEIVDVKKSSLSNTNSEASCSQGGTPSKGISDNLLLIPRQIWIDFSKAVYFTGCKTNNSADTNGTKFLYNFLIGKINEINKNLDESQKQKTVIAAMMAMTQTFDALTLEELAKEYSETYGPITKNNDDHKNFEIVVEHKRVRINVHTAFRTYSDKEILTIDSIRSFAIEENGEITPLELKWTAKQSEAVPVEDDPNPLIIRDDN